MRGVITVDRLTFDGNFCDIAMCRENSCPYDGACTQRKVWEWLWEIERIFGDEYNLDHLRELLQAEKDGRLVVLLCGTDVELKRNGHILKADHWNHTLTAFRDAPENKSGKQVALFSIKEAVAALAGKDIIPCKHGIGRHNNELGEDEIYCELTGRWMNVTLGDCLGNCESEEAALKGGEG